MLIYHTDNTLLYLYVEVRYDFICKHSLGFPTGFPES